MKRLSVSIRGIRMAATHAGLSPAQTKKLLSRLRLLDTIGRKTAASERLALCRRELYALKRDIPTLQRRAGIVP